MKHKILIPFSCYIPESPYICNVFFIVLDLRLTKVGVQRYSFFYAQNTYGFKTEMLLYWISSRDKVYATTTVLTPASGYLFR